WHPLATVRAEVRAFLLLEVPLVLVRTWCWSIHWDAHIFLSKYDNRPGVFSEAAQNGVYDLLARRKSVIAWVGSPWRTNASPTRTASAPCDAYMATSLACFTPDSAMRTTFSGS